METIQEAWAFVMLHWPFFFAAAIFALAGEVMKPIWKKRTGKIANMMEATIPLHTVLAGLIAGRLMDLPVSVQDTNTWTAALYYGGAGMVSNFGYAVFRTLWKKVVLPRMEAASK